MKDWTEEEKEKLKKLRLQFDIWVPETSQDKFHYLANKNKALIKLKNEFKLDTE
jgi:hypothetical protein